jgi:hypothetical protein
MVNIAQAAPGCKNFFNLFLRPTFLPASAMGQDLKAVSGYAMKRYGAGILPPCRFFFLARIVPTGVIMD